MDDHEKLDQAIRTLHKLNCDHLYLRGCEACQAAETALRMSEKMHKINLAYEKQIAGDPLESRIKMLENRINKLESRGK